MTGAELDRLVPRDDFRRAAVEASLQAVRGDLRDDAPPPADCSVCWPVRGSGPDALKPLAWRQVAVVAVGLAGLAAGAGLAALSGGAGNAGRALLAAGGACSLAGMAALFSNQYFLRRFLRGRLGRRYDDLTGAGPGVLVRDVLVEDASTFRTAKLHVEGGGYVAVDADRRRVLLEGVRFRLLIHAADVTSVGTAAGLTMSSPTIAYRCGPRPGPDAADGRPVLHVALTKDSVWREFRRQLRLGAGEDPLLAPLRAALVDPPV